MSGLTDLLRETFGKPEGEALSTVDMMSLPPSVRRIINLMLRKCRISYPDLLKAIAEMPENKRVGQAELDEVLDALCQVGWLDREQAGEVTVYKVSLDPKSGAAPTAGPLDALDKEGKTTRPPA